MLKNNSAFFKSTKFMIDKDQETLKFTRSLQLINENYFLPLHLFHQRLTCNFLLPNHNEQILFLLDVPYPLLFQDKIPIILSELIPEICYPLQVNVVST